VGASRIHSSVGITRLIGQKREGGKAERIDIHSESTHWNQGKLQPQSSSRIFRGEAGYRGQRLRRRCRAGKERSGKTHTRRGKNSLLSDRRHPPRSSPLNDRPAGQKTLERLGFVGKLATHVWQGKEIQRSGGAKLFIGNYYRLRNRNKNCSKGRVTKKPFREGNFTPERGTSCDRVISWNKGRIRGESWPPRS